MIHEISHLGMCCQERIDKFWPGVSNFVEGRGSFTTNGPKKEIRTRKINTDEGLGCNLTLTPQISPPLCAVSNNFS